MKLVKGSTLTWLKVDMKLVKGSTLTWLKADVKSGEGLHPNQVVEDHGWVGVVGPIVELGHHPTKRNQV